MDLIESDNVSASWDWEGHVNLWIFIGTHNTIQKSKRQTSFIAIQH